jgi:hypothetical protein
MSASGVNIVSNNIGALSNDFRPLFKVPTGFGGITILSANYTTETVGTSRVQLVDLGTAGTAIAAAGTLFTSSGGSSVAAAGIPNALASADKVFVSEGTWVGVKEANVGTTGAISIIDVAYVMGK